jgi:hypothetical protein
MLRLPNSRRRFRLDEATCCKLATGGCDGHSVALAAAIAGRCAEGVDGTVFADDHHRFRRTRRAEHHD